MMRYWLRTCDGFHIRNRLQPSAKVNLWRAEVSACAAGLGGIWAVHFQRHDGLFAGLKPLMVSWCASCVPTTTVVT